MRHSLLVNHYVVYLGRKGSSLLIGDPLGGRAEWGLEEMSERWFEAGIVLRGRR